tara:strand:- start:9954 stop:11876 length:1923 start_codon:yes stop_codon:yes gene_type:complete
MASRRGRMDPSRRQEAQQYLNDIIAGKVDVYTGQNKAPINPGKFMGTNQNPAPTNTPSNTSTGNTSTGSSTSTSVKKVDFNSIVSTLENINQSTIAILEILKKDFESEKEDDSKDKKNNAARQRRNKENSEREVRENNAEKKVNLFTSIGKRMLSPVKSILDTIIGYIVNVFLGKVFVDILNWMGDPKNQRKLGNILRFLKDWWPAIIGSYILFGTSFGKFIRSITSLTFRAVASLIRGIANLNKKKLLLGAGNLLKSPAVVLGGGLIAGAAVSSALSSEMINSPSSDPEASPGTNQFDDALDFGGFAADPIGAAFFNGGMNNSDMLNMKMFDAEEGGVVKGKKGKDKNLGWLTDGEIVLTEKARDKAILETGRDPLEFNEDGSPNANKPQIKGNVYYAASGGVIGKDKYQFNYPPMMGLNISPSFNMPKVDPIIDIPMRNTVMDASTSSENDYSSNVVHNVLNTIINHTTDKNTFKTDNYFRDLLENNNYFNNTYSEDTFKTDKYFNSVSDTGNDEINMIKEDTGIDIPGATIDRQQYTFNVQPGEAHVIVPNEVVQRGGLYHIENIINMYDDGTSFASKNSSALIPSPPVKSEPVVTFISEGDTGQVVTPSSDEVVNDIEMLDASFISSRKLKTLGVM